MAEQIAYLFQDKAVNMWAWAPLFTTSSPGAVDLCRSRVLGFPLRKYCLKGL